MSLPETIAVLTKQIQTHSSSLYNTLSEHFAVSDSLVASFAQLTSCKKLAAGETLFKAGDTQQYLYLLTRGLLYAYFVTCDGKSVCKEVYWERDLVFGFRSLLADVPYPFYVAALEDSELLQVSKSEYLNWSQRHPEHQAFHLSVISEYFLYKEGKEEFLLLNTPERRVALFYETYPDLIRRIPQHIIASYLGITPISFSRIKKRLGL